MEALGQTYLLLKRLPPLFYCNNLSRYLPDMVILHGGHICPPPAPHACDCSMTRRVCRLSAVSCAVREETRALAYAQSTASANRNRENYSSVGVTITPPQLMHHLFIRVLLCFSLNLLSPRYSFSGDGNCVIEVDFMLEVVQLKRCRKIPLQ